MKIWKLLIPFCAMIVVGCASQSGTETETDGTGAAGSEGASTSGADSESGGSATALDSDREANLMDATIIYFDFDSSDLDNQSSELAKLHGAYLAENPGVKVRLEGHADERGSREYNLGLGERRAASVRSVLLVQGASASQLSIISFGEERPANTGTGESAWAENRRVEIAYSN
ncbi:MAG: peptidoglycan-associated lipoprotein Pal [Gammaproteobacteria bacterium]|nr:peptidoglycan-associated lipoprotein Pal [Gammaproteobacteria bacterium]MCP4090649.1 peptidoglycan-associated lipoprotein Pal [Gammaproteobacteria bacterium]MCP4274803.1 peptidoglycan-associated lipoprotein Pal [Gammaproteobacteria bacterium]MCP4832196.1 peptidoglycan-associated lipoprotein Pal [Gammaproteobacteria bacterium]MCP4928167.1 peptidoglycan-associated lipoprotein Pal [Gammaproteobacteria bacterium]